MRIILDAKYRKAGINKFMPEKYQQLSLIKEESLLNLLKSRIFVWWNYRHMSYRPGGIGIKG